MYSETKCKWKSWKMQIILLPDVNLTPQVIFTSLPRASSESRLISFVIFPLLNEINSHDNVAFHVSCSSKNNFL